MQNNVIVRKEIFMFSVKYRKLNPEALVPEYSYVGDAGMDLFSIEDIVIPPHKYILVHTGIAIELPPNTEAQIRPRSGLARNYGITVLNSPGTIDQGYRGEICVILVNHSDDVFSVKKHMRIAQMVIKPTFIVELVEADELSSSIRGQGGFGSSGINERDEQI